jgi:hypothetical protein
MRREAAVPDSSSTPKPAPEAHTVADSGEPVAQCVAIVAVHGVIPHPRYEIQDQCAKQLARALNGDPNWQALGTWVASVLNPRDSAVRETLTPHPTISRVRLEHKDPVRTTPPYFDVIEAYWSPIDKGKTTFAKLIAWLLRTVIVPMNTTARYMASGKKTAYDIAFITGAILVAIGSLLWAFRAAAKGLDHLLIRIGNCGADSTCPTVWQIFSNPAKLAEVFTLRTLFALAAGAAGAVLVILALKAFASMIGQRNALRKRPAQLADRRKIIAIVLLAGILLLFSCWFFPAGDGDVLGKDGLWFVFPALLLELGLTIGKSFFVNFFGDVQIYTAHDQNSEFFAMREQMLALVTQTVGRACSGKANDGLGYDRVYVLAHSLGSTISLDAMMRLSNLARQDPSSSESDASLEADLRKLRGFVSFGCPLEKTKYFTDVLDPSPSAARDQWRDDLYGSLFTADAAQLDRDNQTHRGIFWANYWYFADAIANEIESYRSFVPPGVDIAQGHGIRLAAARAHPEGALGRLVCRNERGHKGLQLNGILPHGDYLEDDWFWKTNATAKPRPHLGVLDIVARWRFPRHDEKLALFASTVRVSEEGTVPFTIDPDAKLPDLRKYFDRVPPPGRPGA